MNLEAIVHPKYRSHVGYSPAGVEWICYARRGETIGDYLSRKGTMHERLAKLWSKKS